MRRAGRDEDLPLEVSHDVGRQIRAGLRIQHQVRADLREGLGGGACRSS